MHSETRQLFRNFADTAIERIVREIKSIKYTTELNVSWQPATIGNPETGDRTVVPEGSLHTEYYRKPDYYRIVHSCRQSVTELDEFSDLKDNLLSKYKNVAKYHSISDKLDQILLRFISDLIDRSETDTIIDFLEEDFDELYEEYMSSLTDSEIPFSAIIPLAGLAFDGNPIKLDEQTHIRHTTIEDLEFFYKNADWEEQMHWTHSKSLIEHKFYKEKSTERGRDTDLSRTHRTEIKQRVENILTSMRISHSGNAVYYAHYERAKAPWFRGRRSIVEKNHVRPLLWGDLTLDQRQKLIDTYRTLESKNFPSMETNLRMAIERFNSSYIRENDRVAFSDLMVILEALYSADSGQERLHRSELAQRVAILLGDGIQSREEIYNDITSLYDERSGVWGVAHGGGRKELSEDSLESVRNYVRKSLERILVHERDFGGRNNLVKAMKDEIRKSSFSTSFP